jgi:hypothetical protein
VHGAGSGTLSPVGVPETRWALVSGGSTLIALSAVVITARTGPRTLVLSVTVSRSATSLFCLLGCSGCRRAKPSGREPGGPRCRARGCCAPAALSRCARCAARTAWAPTTPRRCASPARRSSRSKRCSPWSERRSDGEPTSPLNDLAPARAGPYARHGITEESDTPCPRTAARNYG